MSEISDIVGARNTSNQVMEQSLLELEKKFNPIKNVLKDKFYFNNIAFKEYELDEKTMVPKSIDIREIVAIMYMFNKDLFSAHKHPIKAYSTKASCLNHFKDSIEKKNSIYEKLYPLLPDFLRLRDELYLKLPDLYNKAGKLYRDNVTGGRFGSVTGVNYYDESPKVELPFIKKKSHYRIPVSFIYPLLAAFRVFVDTSNGKYRWHPDCDPFKLIDGDLGLNLANALANVVLEDRSPNKTGKSVPLWTNCYKEADSIFKDIEISQLKQRLNK